MMGLIEMRWLDRKIGMAARSKTLQYRQLILSTNSWTDWVDVPTVTGD